MKKVFITLSLLLFAFVARAQRTLHTYDDYTRASGSSASLALKGDYQMTDNLNNGKVTPTYLVLTVGEKVRYENKELEME